MFSGSPVDVMSSVLELSTATASRTSERGYIGLNPLQCKPLVLETEVTVNFRLCARKETKSREPVAYVDVDFALCFSNILSVSTHSMGRTELQEPELL